MKTTGYAGGQKGLSSEQKNSYDKIKTTDNRKIIKSYEVCRMGNDIESLAHTM